MAKNEQTKVSFFTCDLDALVAGLRGVGGDDGIFPCLQAAALGALFGGSREASTLYIVRSDDSTVYPVVAWGPTHTTTLESERRRVHFLLIPARQVVGRVGELVQDGVQSLQVMPEGGGQVQALL